METVSLVASFVSVIIAAFAIWLSVKFYQMSSIIAENTKEASKSIAASVDRLESLFDRLYSDTFSMMKDTVTDMRKHMWPDKDESPDALAIVEQKADEKIEAVRSEIASELSTMMRQVGQTDSKIAGVEDRLTQLVDKAIQQTRRVESEAQEELSLSDVLSGMLQFMHRYGDTSLRRMYRHPTLRRRFPRDMISDALEILLRENMVSVNGPLDDPNTIVSPIHPLTREDSV